MTSLYDQYYNAVHETAIYADLWRCVQNGISDDNTPRATLREILFPPRFENITPPPTYDNEPPTSGNEILLQMPRPETPEQQTPRRPTLLQNHPGEDWYLNHPRGKRAYPFNSYPRLTPPQIRIFDYDIAGRPEVNRALLALDDWPVAGEVDYYRTLTTELEEQYNQAARLRRTIAETMAQQIIQREDNPDLWCNATTAFSST
ncbi:hypothetical protein EDB87DRAFT_1696901 [Lactarius vividus]|nr:hypothetical protein EDB87DRAFT_1696901 [Lactarius vividus]